MHPATEQWTAKEFGTTTSYSALSPKSAKCTRQPVLYQTKMNTEKTYKPSTTKTPRTKYGASSLDHITRQFQMSNSGIRSQVSSENYKIKIVWCISIPNVNRDTSAIYHDTHQHHTVNVEHPPNYPTKHSRH